jgi:hypothetical protein
VELGLVCSIILWQSPIWLSNLGFEYARLKVAPPNQCLQKLVDLFVLNIFAPNLLWFSHVAC